MTYKTEQVVDWLCIARSAAREASNVLMAGYRKRPKADKKGPIDFVTEFDRKSESVLRTVLAKTGVAFVGEEDGGVERTETFFVDPLDGTTNFVHGHPFFAISIGLLRESVPVLGVVLAPALGVEWFGASGLGAFRNEEACSVSQTSALEDSLLATGFPYDRATSVENNFERFVRLKKKTRGVRRCGCASIDLALVADGTYDGYWERKLKPWDLAAGAALVTAANGHISAFDGSHADIRSGHLVATNGGIHEALLRELGDA